MYSSLLSFFLPFFPPLVSFLDLLLSFPLQLTVHRRFILSSPLPSFSFFLFFICLQQPHPTASLLDGLLRLRAHEDDAADEGMAHHTSALDDATGENASVLDSSCRSLPGSSLSLLTSANELSLMNISAHEDELSQLEAETVEHLGDLTDHSVLIDVSHLGG